jgi:hypothetical protein
MAARIEDDFMTAEHDGRVIATARYSSDAEADGQGRRVVLSFPRQWLSQDQAITAMVLAERLAAGHSDDDLFVVGWREELGLRPTGSSELHGGRGCGRRGGDLLLACARAGVLTRGVGAIARLVPNQTNPVLERVDVAPCRRALKPTVHRQQSLSASNSIGHPLPIR